MVNTEINLKTEKAKTAKIFRKLENKCTFRSSTCKKRLNNFKQQFEAWKKS